MAEKSCENCKFSKFKDKQFLGCVNKEKQDCTTDTLNWQPLPETKEEKKEPILERVIEQEMKDMVDKKTKVIEQEMGQEKGKGK
jgi:hypothetical protein